MNPPQQNQTGPIRSTRQRQRTSYDADRGSPYSPSSRRARQQAAPPPPPPSPPALPLGTAATIKTPDIVFANKKCPITGSMLPTDAEIPEPTTVKTLETAIQLGYLDKGQAGSHAQKKGRAHNIAKLIYVVHHYVSDNDWDAYINWPENHSGDSEKVAYALTMRNVRNWQHAAGTFFANVVQNTRAMFELPVFDASSAEDRARIWVYLFDRAPFTTTKDMLGPTGTPIDLEGILLQKDSGPNGRREHLRDYFCMMFVWGCEFMFKWMDHKDNSVVPDFDKISWYEDWRAITIHPDWVAGHPGVWTLAAMPCRPLT